MDKSDNYWPCEVHVGCRSVSVKGWEQDQWYIKDLRMVPSAGATSLDLYLLLTDRLDYRMNLQTNKPLLFVLCQENSAGAMEAIHISATQTFAADYMDVEDHLIIATPMPDIVIGFIESYLAKEGEGELPKKKKSRYNRGKKQRAQ